MFNDNRNYKTFTLPPQHDPPSNEGGVNALVSIINSSSSGHIINVSNASRDNNDINAFPHQHGPPSNEGGD